MITSLTNPNSLTTSLQEKLEAAVQSPHVFSKLAEKNIAVSLLNNGAISTSLNRVSPGNVPNSSETSSVSVDAKTNYRDYSRYVPDDKDAASVVNQTNTTKEPTFPVKLHKILSNPEFQDIISWLPHGRSWRILQQKAFEERVIPLYFRHGRYSSFARQVNGWGFRRVTHGSDYNSYYHEMFLRGMPHLCDKMRRLTSKDAAARKKCEDEPAPDFYAISRTSPLPDATAPAPIKSSPVASPNPTLSGNNILQTGLLGGGVQGGASAQSPGFTGTSVPGSMSAMNIGNQASQAFAANLGFANQLSGLQGFNTGPFGAGVQNVFSSQDFLGANLSAGTANLGTNFGTNFGANFGTNFGAANLGANLNAANIGAANLAGAMNLAGTSTNFGGVTNFGAATNFGSTNPLASTNLSHVANLNANFGGGSNTAGLNNNFMLGGSSPGTTNTGNGLEDMVANSNNLSQLLASNPMMLSELLRAQTSQSQTADIAQLLGMNQ